MSSAQSAVKITYRKGLPSKKSMYELIEAFFERPNYRPNLSQLWGTYESPISARITWTDTRINTQMPAFCGFLATYGINTENFEPYDRPRVGSIEVVRKNKTK